MQTIITHLIDWVHSVFLSSGEQFSLLLISLFCLALPVLHHKGRPIGCTLQAWPLVQRVCDRDRKWVQVTVVWLQCGACSGSRAPVRESGLVDKVCQSMLFGLLNGSLQLIEGTHSRFMCVHTRFAAIGRISDFAQATPRLKGSGICMHTVDSN